MYDVSIQSLEHPTELFSFSWFFIILNPKQESKTFQYFSKGSLVAAIFRLYWSPREEELCIKIYREILKFQATTGIPGYKGLIY